MVLDTDPPRCGLVSTLRPVTHPGGPPVPSAGRLLERSGRELAGLLHSSSTLETSIGMAVFNALLEVDEETSIEINAEDVIPAKRTGQRIAIVGHFPFIEQVRRAIAG